MPQSPSIATHAPESRSRRVASISGGTTDGRRSIPVSRIPAVNVASVPQRSPLRYPGGKTWLVPHIREWLGTQRAKVLFEPFAGGAIVSLTAVMEGLADRCVLVELDRDVAAFWHSALNHADELCDRIESFVPTRQSIQQLCNEPPASLVDHGFRTLVLNRTRRGGILAPGASLIRAGEGDRGVASRWYPATLIRRLRDIQDHADAICFCEGDGAKLLESQINVDDAAVFVDPPYTAGGKRAGRRLYAHNRINHKRLFELLDDASVDFLMTYDFSPEVVALVERHNFSATRVMMKNNHHARMSELVITRNAVFAPQPDR